jgi:hypothetical protein
MNIAACGQVRQARRSTAGALHDLEEGAIVREQLVFAPPLIGHPVSPESQLRAIMSGEPIQATASRVRLEPA